MIFLLMVAAALVALAGCGAKHVTVTLTPPNATVQPGDSVWFAAAVTGARDTGVTWSLAEQQAGTLYQGLYNAPQRAGTFRITAASVENSKARGVAAVTVTPMPVVLDPVMITVPRNKVKSFGAIVIHATAIDATGEHPASVTWSIREKDGGTITPTGAYTPPAKPGTYHIVATARDNPGATAIAGVLILE